MPKEDEINWILDEVSHYLSAGKCASCSVVVAVNLITSRIRCQGSPQ